MARPDIDPNGSRFAPGDRAGFYESYFQRANHPTRPLAFWIRYTVFSPRGRPDQACGELWALWFDGEQQRIVAAREQVPLPDCAFSRTSLDVRIGGATLVEGALAGRAASAGHELRWRLRHAGGQGPLLLLPRRLYAGSFPKAKSLVTRPNAAFNGSLVVDGEDIAIEDWRGSLNHNWGSRHTDRYAWGQVAGFDAAPDSFLECCTAQVRLGPLWTPRLSFVVLRHEGEEYALNGLAQAVRASGRFDFFTWSFDTRDRGHRIRGHFRAPADAFAGLSYRNPPGGVKTCLNSKLASAEITLERAGRPPQTLATRHRAAFEILTDRSDHGVAMLA